METYLGVWQYPFLPYSPNYYKLWCILCLFLKLILCILRTRGPWGMLLAKSSWISTICTGLWRYKYILILVDIFNNMSYHLWLRSSKLPLSIAQPNMRSLRFKCRQGATETSNILSCDCACYVKFAGIFSLSIQQNSFDELILLKKKENKRKEVEWD